MGFFSKNLDATDPQGNALDPEVWSTKIMTDGLEKNSLSEQFGEMGSGALIGIDEDLSAQPGSTMNYTFVPYNKTKTILGNTTSIKANTDRLSEYGLPINIHIATHSFGRKGRLTDQRLVWKYRTTAKNQLSRRQIDYTEDVNFAVMSGVSYTEIEDDLEPHLSATDTTDRVNGDTRCLGANGGSGSQTITAANSDNTAIIGALNSSDKMNVDLVEALYIQARSRDPYIIQPLQFDEADPMYVLFMSLKAARDLRKDPQFEKYQLAKINAGLKNDAFGRRAFGQWDNVLLMHSERIIEFGASGNKFARNLFCGAEAAINIFGALQADFTEEVDDHKTDYTAAVATVRSESKVTFNGTDVNIIQAVTASN